MANKKNETEEMNDNPVLGPNTQKLAAIKELIFGENMADYEMRFKEMVQRQNEIRENLEEQIKALNEQLTQALNANVKELNNRCDTMDKNTKSDFEKMNDKKADRRVLGKMLQSMGEKLQA